MSLAYVHFNPLKSFYFNGVKSVDMNDYKSDMAQNSTLELIIDCDLRTIRLTNERTYSRNEIGIDLAKCPFPWQVFVCLNYAHDQVRMLPSTSFEHDEVQ